MMAIISNERRFLNMDPGLQGTRPSAILRPALFERVTTDRERNLMKSRVMFCLLAAGLAIGGCSKKAPEKTEEYFPVAPKIVEPTPSPSAPPTQAKNPDCDEQPSGSECVAAEQQGEAVAEVILKGAAPKATGGQLVPGVYTLVGLKRFIPKGAKADRGELHKKTLIVSTEGPRYTLQFIESQQGCADARSALSAVPSAGGILKTSDICPKCEKDCDLDVRYSATSSTLVLYLDEPDQVTRTLWFALKTRG